MIRRSYRWMAVACLWGAIGGIPPATARGDQDESSRPPTMAIGAGHHPTSRPGRPAKSAPSGSGGMWIGTAGIALALAAFGGLSLAAKKFKVAGDAGPLKVIGRTCLSPKHTVYLLKAGDRVLIVGAGSQGAPTLLGELRENGGGS